MLAVTIVETELCGGGRYFPKTTLTNETLRGPVPVLSANSQVATRGLGRLLTQHPHNAQNPTIGLSCRVTAIGSRHCGPEYCSVSAPGAPSLWFTAPDTFL